MDSRDAAIFWTPVPIPSGGLERGLDALGAGEAVGQVFVGHVFSKTDWGRGRKFLLRAGAARAREEWARLGPAERFSTLREIADELAADGVSQANIRTEFAKIAGWKGA